MKIKQILKTARTAIQQVRLLIAQQNITPEQADQIVKKHQQQLTYKQQLMTKGKQLLQKYTQQYTPRGFKPGDPSTKEYMGLGVVWSGETELPRNVATSLQNNPAISGLLDYPQQIKQHEQEISKYQEQAKQQPQAKQQVQQPQAQQPQAKQQVQQPQAQQPQAKQQVQQPQYVVQKGDTLSGIAKRLQDQAPGLTWQALAKHNNIKDPNKIEINQKINIPNI